MDKIWESHKSNPYLSGDYAPVSKELNFPWDQLEVVGEIPSEISGCYFRNGPNPMFPPKGRHHWFDGDGMVHGLKICDGKASYLNRWVTTRGLIEERKAGRSLWTGLIEPDLSHPVSPLKDSANTDLIFHKGRLFATWYNSGAVYELDPDTLKTLGVADFQRTHKIPVASHPKADEKTGHVMLFNLLPTYPYMNYMVVDQHWNLIHQVPVELPGVRFSHDIAITDNFTLLFDFPVVLNPQALKSGKWRMDFNRDLPSRIGIIPRFGQAEDIRWFEGRSGYSYHVINAWEEGRKVILTGCFTPEPVRERLPGESELDRMLKNLQVRACLYRWEMDLESGALTESVIDDLNTEFPMINNAYQGQKNDFSYLMHLAEEKTLLFDGLIKYDIHTGVKKEYYFEKGLYCSEAPYVPGQISGQEDGGYLVTFVTGAKLKGSEAWIFSAENPDEGPVARIKIPARIPLGFHSCWADDPQAGGKLYGVH